MILIKITRQKSIIEPIIRVLSTRDSDPNTDSNSSRGAWGSDVWATVCVLWTCFISQRVKWPTVVSNIDYENGAGFKQIPYIYASTILHRFSIPINKVFIVCSTCHMFSRLFLFRLILRFWRWRQHVHPKRRLTFSRLHGVIFQKIKIFLTTAARTSDSTYSLSVLFSTKFCTTLHDNKRQWLELWSPYLCSFLSRSWYLFRFKQIWVTARLMQVVLRRRSFELVFVDFYRHLISRRGIQV
jgi:hypothetical protein